MSLLLGILAAVPLAHPSDIPHTEQVAQKAGEGTPVAVILVGVTFALLMVGALVYLRERMRDEGAAGAADDERSGLRTHDDVPH